MENKIPLWLLTVMFAVNFGCMIAGFTELFGHWTIFARSMNAFFFVTGSVGVALNITILMRSQS